MNIPCVLPTTDDSIHSQLSSALNRADSIQDMYLAAVIKLALSY